MSSKAGPFEVNQPRSRVFPRPMAQTALAGGRVCRSHYYNPLQELELQALQETPVDLESVFRDFECESYDLCLCLAAALDWSSFTCHGCCKVPNRQLVWRASQCVKRDKSLAKFVKLPKLSK